jgi:rhodanese-related sulfurtransferase
MSPAVTDMLSSPPINEEDPMPTSLKDMMAAAKAAVPQLSPAEAVGRIRAGDVLVVDVRDGTELQASGKIKGAVHVPRGLLEFRADPDSPSYDPAFSKDKTIVVHCASGGRSALAAKTLHDMGYTSVANGGGFKDLVDAGAQTEAM